MKSFGQYLINEVLPEGYKVEGPITNKGLHDHVVSLARQDPESYVRTVLALKRTGDEIASLEGISVGLDDIEPEYDVRDALLAPAIKAFDSAKTPAEREKIIVDTQARALDLTKKHPGSMTHMTLSGARGKPAQLQKIVVTPLATIHPKTGLVPRILDRSYSEGLTPAQYWLAGPEVRANEVSARISVSEPGEMAKVLVNNMIGTIVTTPDCETTNGIMMSTSDPHIMDRYTQATAGLARNTLLTARVVQDLHRRNIEKILVRSPMTCAATTGVCQHCQGLNEKGQHHGIGTTVGVRAAQAMAEPLTQMTLSSRHGTLTVKATEKLPGGLRGVRQLLEVPEAFRFEAALAPKHGVVQRIEKAPQGGHYISISGEVVYAGPDLHVLVKVGDPVEQGDALTDGVPHPVKVVQAKGIGAGRAYFADTLHRIYAKEGVNLDKRHLELLAKTEINHLRLLEEDPEHPELLKGDLLQYNTFRETYGKDAIEVPVHDAIGRRLAKEVLHHTAGTEVTPALARQLEASHITRVSIAPRMPPVEFVMRPFAMNPLLDPDWMGKLSHRYLKNTLAEGAHFGAESDIHGTHPVPAYAYGKALRTGAGGTF